MSTTEYMTRWSRQQGWRKPRVLKNRTSSLFRFLYASRYAVTPENSQHLSIQQHTKDNFGDGRIAANYCANLNITFNKSHNKQQNLKWTFDIYRFS